MRSPLLEFEGDPLVRTVVRNVGDVTQALMRWAERERCSPWPSSSHDNDDGLEEGDALKMENRSV